MCFFTSFSVCHAFFIHLRSLASKVTMHMGDSRSERQVPGHCPDKLKALVGHEHH